MEMLFESGAVPSRMVTIPCFQLHLLPHSMNTIMRIADGFKTTILKRVERVLSTVGGTTVTLTFWT